MKIAAYFLDRTCYSKTYWYIKDKDYPSNTDKYFQLTDKDAELWKTCVFQRFGLILNFERGLMVYGLLIKKQTFKLNF